MRQVWTPRVGPPPPPPVPCKTSHSSPFQSHGRPANVLVYTQWDMLLFLIVHKPGIRLPLWCCPGAIGLKRLNYGWQSSKVWVIPVQKKALLWPPLFQCKGVTEAIGADVRLFLAPLVDDDSSSSYHGCYSKNSASCLEIIQVAPSRGPM